MAHCQNKDESFKFLRKELNMDDLNDLSVDTWPFLSYFCWASYTLIYQFWIDHYPDDDDILII